MKKSLIYIFAVLAAVMFTSCSDNDEPVNKQSFTSTINTRAIEGDAVYFSQNSAKVEVNYTGMTIQFSTTYADINGHSHSFTTGEMKMTLASGTVYTFTNSAASGNDGISSLKGYLDMATGMMWYSFMADGTTTVVNSSHLLYAYSTTTVTNPDNGYTYNHQNSAYLFAIDSKGETCTMRISNFAPNITGSIQALEIQFNDLKVVPTLTGYTITADEADSNYSGFYTITDLAINLDSQCQVINGSFKCSDLDFKITGDLFPNVF